MKFFLGTHRPSWLEQYDVPMFVSRRTLGELRKLPRARGEWALDSGGFTELSMFGRWTLSPAEYAREVRRFRDEIGGLAWAAPQDWMCEPAVREKTGLSVAEHQRRTLENYLELMAIAPDLPWAPVIQGWGYGEYWRHVDAYYDAGVDLRKAPIVGVGTVCRRQGTIGASSMIGTLAAEGLKLHGFGFKASGLKLCADRLASADSLAWSLNARKHPPMPGHDHKSCANCSVYALTWREDLLSRIAA